MALLHESLVLNEIFPVRLCLIVILDFVKNLLAHLNSGHDPCHLRNWWHNCGTNTWGSRMTGHPSCWLPLGKLLVDDIGGKRGYPYLNTTARRFKSTTVSMICICILYIYVYIYIYILYIYTYIYIIYIYTYINVLNNLNRWYSIV